VTQSRGQGAVADARAQGEGRVLYSSWNSLCCPNLDSLSNEEGVGSGKQKREKKKYRLLKVNYEGKGEEEVTISSEARCWKALIISVPTATLHKQAARKRRGCGWKRAYLSCASSSAPCCHSSRHRGHRVSAVPGTPASSHPSFSSPPASLCLHPLPFRLPLPHSSPPPLSFPLPFPFSSPPPAPPSASPLPFPLAPHLSCLLGHTCKVRPGCAANERPLGPGCLLWGQPTVGTDDGPRVSRI